MGRNAHQTIRKDTPVPHSYTHIYVHFVWATWDRAPLITRSLEAPLYACIAKECRDLKCDVIAIGGMEDHVHALVRLHSAVSAAALAKAMKGSSSHLVTHILAPGREFKWQGTYGAFSVSADHLELVRAYIGRQKEHHGRSSVRPEWERCAEVEPGGERVDR
jgi:REP element-mobilizing transposase RayT